MNILTKINRPIITTSLVVSSLLLLRNSAMADETVKVKADKIPMTLKKA